jgi:hypothetical protein
MLLTIDAPEPHQARRLAGTCIERLSNRLVRTQNRECAMATWAEIARLGEVEISAADDAVAATIGNFNEGVKTEAAVLEHLKVAIAEYYKRRNLPDPHLDPEFRKREEEMRDKSLYGNNPDLVQDVVNERIEKIKKGYESATAEPT